MTDHEPEPVPGLPEPLPPGEKIILQAKPDWRSFAVHAFHARKIALYCAAIVAWRIGADLFGGMSLAAALVDGAKAAPIALAGVIIPIALAWFYARTSIYTLTDRRLVMRIGVALPMTFNLPYRQIESAALRLYRDGTGDIPLALRGDVRLAFVHLWPHVRGWRINHPQPMLRALPDAQRFADLLAAALKDANAAPAPRSEDRAQPVGAQPLATAAA
jgi:hypothetical protein